MDAPRKTSSLSCELCGSAFQAKRSDARFCDSCKDHRALEHGRRPRPERATGRRALLLCGDCGVTYTAQRNDSERCPTCRADRERYLARRYARPDKQNACPQCGATKQKSSATCLACRGKRFSGSNNPNWKGGRTRHDGGYIQIRTNRPGRHAYELEHIVVWEAANGPVPPDHHVHHINGVKTDNRLENLVALPHKEHPHWNRKPYEAQIRALEARIQELERSTRAE